MVKDHYLENPYVQARAGSVDVFDFPKPSCRSKVISGVLSAICQRRRSRKQKEGMKCIHISAPILTAQATPQQAQPTSATDTQHDHVQDTRRKPAQELRHHPAQRARHDLAQEFPQPHFTPPVQEPDRPEYEDDAGSDDEAWG